MSDQDWSEEPNNRRETNENEETRVRTPSPAPREEKRQRSQSPSRGGDNSDRGRSTAPQNTGNNLHLSGIALGCEERDLEDLFGKYGRVTKCQLMRDPHTRDVRGFGFVTMETTEEAEAAITNLNATEFLGKILSVGKARRGRGRTPTPGQYRGPQRVDDRRRYDDRRSYDDRRPRGGRDDYDGGSRDYYDRDFDRRRRDDYYDDRRDSYRDDYKRSSRSGGYDDRDRYDRYSSRSDRRDERYDRDDRRY